MTAPCPGYCGHAGPGPSAFRLYNVLNCAATAVDEAASGASFPAEAEWMEACVAGSGLFTPGSEPDAAIAVVLEACGPGAKTGDPVPLRKALDAACTAVLYRMTAKTGDPFTTAKFRSAGDAATLLEPRLREALTVILAAASDTSGVTA